MIQKRIRDFGITIGQLETGKNNAITDISGVTVGHVTIQNGDIQTGVTAVLPHQGNIYKEKVIASSHVINGFGKTMGTIQINELGTIETPIILTNTLSVGVAADALIDYMLENNLEIGRTTGTINPVICECNDMFLNDIRAKAVTKAHVFEAITKASSTIEEGTVGAGTGMSCYSLKGGIGTASRQMKLAHGAYTMGVLALTNFGLLHDLKINGLAVGEQLSQHLQSAAEEQDKGSVIIIVGTDLPVSERQLNRIIKRTVTGLSRTGSIMTTGSGEIAIGFSTATRIPHEKTATVSPIAVIHEEDIDLAFRAVGEATEEAVLNSLITATHVVGRAGNERLSLKDLLDTYHMKL